MTHTDSTKRHDFALFFDVRDGNPNGDPDAGNLPRVDPETMHGIVTDVCLKRKVRDYAHEVAGAPIFVQSEKSLNARIEEVAQAHGIEKPKNSKVAIPGLGVHVATEYLDVRLFGAVLSTGDYNAGQLRGPLQLTFARSVEPVLPLDITITRQARTTDERAESGQTEIGRKAIVPYALYRGHGFYSPHLAERSGVSDDDLTLFWEALSRMFEYDRSAARGEMTLREVYIFTHDNPRGNAPAHKLLERVSVDRAEVKGGNGTEPPPAREFADYTLGVDETDLPPGVTLTKLTDVAWS